MDAGFLAITPQGSSKIVYFARTVPEFQSRLISPKRYLTWKSNFKRDRFESSPQHSLAFKEDNTVLNLCQNKCQNRNACSTALSYSSTEVSSYIDTVKDIERVFNIINFINQNHFKRLNTSWRLSCRRIWQEDLCLSRSLPLSHLSIWALFMIGCAFKDNILNNLLIAYHKLPRIGPIIFSEY